MELRDPLNDATGAADGGTETDWRERENFAHERYQEKLAETERRCAEARFALQHAEARCEILGKENNEIELQLRRLQKSLEEARVQIAREIGEKEEAHIEIANEIAAREQSDTAVHETRTRLAIETDARERVEAALSHQYEYTERLKEEIRSFSTKIRELLEERSSWVAMAAFRKAIAPSQCDWSVPEEPVEEERLETMEPKPDLVEQKLEKLEPKSFKEPSSFESCEDAEPEEQTEIVNLSDFLNLAEVQDSTSYESEGGGSGDRTPRESSSFLSHSSPTAGSGLLRSYLRKSAAKQPNLRDMLSRAFGGGHGRTGDDIELLLPILAEAPPTRQVVRGVVGVDVDRLRVAVANTSETLPKSTRGALWSEAVGNRLRLSEEQYVRTIRRRNRLRVVLEARGRSYTAHTNELVEGMEPEELSLVDSALQQISLDLNRTLSTRHVEGFGKAGDLQAAFQDVLEAFVIYKPEYGYTQGMSFLAALMVLHMDTYHAFVCFSNVVLLQPWLSACYSFEMECIRCYFDVFDELLLSCVPKVGRHFLAIEFQSEVVLIEWWFTLFVRSLPLDIVVRLWDAFFLEGDFLLFRASLAIMQHFTEPLLARARDECLALLASWPSTHLEAVPFFETFDKVHLTEKRLAAAFAKRKGSSQRDASGSKS